MAVASSAAIAAIFIPLSSFAQAMTAGVVVENMEADHRYPYATGIIEGLAYARYQRDGKQIEGMKCIYDWGTKAETVAKIYEAFAAFPDYTPGAVVAAMAEKECGK